MYSVYGTYTENGQKSSVCIYSDKYVSPDMKAVNPNLTLTDNAAGSLDITLTVGNAGYDKLKRMRSEITVYKEDKEIWSGRILSEKRDFQNNRILTCEGELAYLNDTVQPPAEYSQGLKSTDDEENKTGVTLYEFLDKVLAEHNKYVDDDKKFYIDKSYIWNQNETLPVICTNYETTLECISANVTERFGGHILVEKKIEEKNGEKIKKRYLKYLEKGLNQNSQIIRFGESLLDFTRNWDLSDLATVIVPRGAKLEESDISEDLEAYLTVSEIEFTDEETKERVIKLRKDEKGNFTLGVLDNIYDETERTITLSPVNKVITLKYDNIRVVPTVYGYDEEDNEIARESELFTEKDNQGYIILRLDDDNDVILARDENGAPSVTWDGMYVSAKRSLSEYGRIEKVVDFGDETDGITLLEKAKQYLEESQFDEMVLEVSAVDLSYLSENNEPLSILDTVQCVSKPHGMNYASFSVTKLSLQLDRPDSAKYTLESTVKSSVGSNSLSAATNSASRDIIQKIENLPTKQSILTRAQKNADRLISEATNGYVTIVLEEKKAEKGKHSEALVISSGPDYNTSEHYWLWNVKGLAHYTNGVEDNPNLAITMEGQIVADYITTGTMSADRVRTGFLVSEDGNVVWNLNANDISYGRNTYSAGSLTIQKGLIKLGGGKFSVDDKGELYSVSGNIGGFTINDDGIYNDALELNDVGLHFMNGRTRIGSFSPNFWTRNEESYGVVTNLSTEGEFMSWGVQKSSAQDLYDYKLFYVARNNTLLKNNGGYFKGNTLYFGCPVDFNNQEIRNFNHNFDKDNPLLLYPNSNCKVNYGYTNKVILPTQVSSTGTIVQADEVFIDHGFVCGINALYS